MLSPVTRALLALAIAHLVAGVVQPLDMSEDLGLPVSLGEDDEVGTVPKYGMLQTSGMFTLKSASNIPKPLEEELGESDSVSSDKPSVVEAVHDDSDAGLDLGEPPTSEGAFRYTNGAYGGGTGKKKWLKCTSKCKGTGYGGYGYCLTKGEGNPWGGCMAPGASPSSVAPPKLYRKNRVGSLESPRAHRFCKNGKDLWMHDGKQMVAACSECKSENYFLVPNQHVKNMLVGTCFRIDQYPAWIKAVQAALDGSAAALQCSSFVNSAGMKSKYFGGAQKAQWDSSPRKGGYQPRGFVCTSSSSVQDHSVQGLLKKGFRRMQLFSTSVARFVMCYTNSQDATSLRCVKKKRIGRCKTFSMRNAAFDETAYHLRSPSTNSTGVNWKKETTKWDAKALKLGKAKLMGDDSDDNDSIGLQDCSEDWNERMLSLH
jgi:hypothetical protein